MAILASIEIIEEDGSPECSFLIKVQFAQDGWLREIGDLFERRIIERAIPDSVRVISAFLGYVELEEVRFGRASQLRKISGFSDYRVRTLNIKDSVTAISGFNHFRALTRVVFRQASVLMVIKGFRECRVEVIDVPDTMEGIGRRAFSNYWAPRGPNFREKSRIEKLLVRGKFFLKFPETILAERRRMLPDQFATASHNHEVLYGDIWGVPPRSSTSIPNRN